MSNIDPSLKDKIFIEILIIINLIFVFFGFVIVVYYNFLLIYEKKIVIIT